MSSASSAHAAAAALRDAEQRFNIDEQRNALMRLLDLAEDHNNHSDLGSANCVPSLVGVLRSSSSRQCQELTAQMLECANSRHRARGG